MAKPFMTYEQQITYLVEKHMVIPDRTRAELTLRRIGYFALICGYKHPFKNPTTKMYCDGVTFDDVTSLYRFDEALRELFLIYLLSVEREIKSLIAYRFCEKYGENHQAYLDPANYNDAPQKKPAIRWLIGQLDKLVHQQTDYQYIEHQKSKHGNVPLWVLVSAMTFGNVAKMFGFLTQDLQSRIARNFPLNITQLDQMLSVLTKYRNVCAHGERLFSYTTRDDIPNLPLHVKLMIPKNGEQFIFGKRDLLAVVIALRYLLPREEFSVFKNKLSKLIAGFSANCDALSEADLLNSMGFPAYWKKITSYKLV